MRIKQRSLKIAFASLLVGLFLVGCATTPPPNASLNEARDTVGALSDNERLMRLAAPELREAQDQLAKAQRSWSDGADAAEVSHQSRIAVRLADIAIEAAKIRDAEQQIERLRNQRDQLRLQSRASRAELSAYEERLRAQRAEMDRAEAEAARLAEAAERSRAELAREQAVAQQRLAELERQQAEEQRLLAEQRAEELERQTERMRAEADRLQQQLVDLQAQATERGLVLTLGSDVLFDFDRAELKPGSQRTIERIAAFLNEYPERRVLVEGFTDGTGTRDYNLDLSERRANAVRNALVDLGVAVTRIEVAGYGPEYPVASNDTDAGRQLNRRVEVVISDDDQAVPDR